MGRRCLAGRFATSIRDRLCKRRMSQKRLTLDSSTRALGGCPSLPSCMTTGGPLQLRARRAVPRAKERRAGLWAIARARDRRPNGPGRACVARVRAVCRPGLEPGPALRGMRLKIRLGSRLPDAEEEYSPSHIHNMLTKLTRSAMPLYVREETVDDLADQFAGMIGQSKTRRSRTSCPGGCDAR